MSIFKRTPLTKKSTGTGLFKQAETKLHERHGADTQQVPAAGFPTSEDLKNSQGKFGSWPDDNLDPDGSFLHGEVQQVSSSNVAWLRYEGNVLYVGYQNGTEYYCAGVDPSTALQIRRAHSVGAALKNLEQSRGAFSRV